MVEMRDVDVDCTMTEEEIMEKVLGKKKGLIPGLGLGQVPKRAWNYEDGVDEMEGQVEEADARAEAATARAEQAEMRYAEQLKLNEEMRSKMSSMETVLANFIKQFQEDDGSESDSEL